MHSTISGHLHTPGKKLFTEHSATIKILKQSYDTSPQLGMAQLTTGTSLRPPLRNSSQKNSQQSGARTNPAVHTIKPPTSRNTDRCSVQHLKRSNYSRETSRLNWTHMTYQAPMESTSLIPLTAYRRPRSNSNDTTAAQPIIKDPSIMTTRTGQRSSNHVQPFEPTLRTLTSHRGLHPAAHL